MFSPHLSGASQAFAKTTFKSYLFSLFTYFIYCECLLLTSLNRKSLLILLPRKLTVSSSQGVGNQSRSVRIPEALYPGGRDASFKGVAMKIGLASGAGHEADSAAAGSSGPGILTTITPVWSQRCLLPHQAQRIDTCFLNHQQCYLTEQCPQFHVYSELTRCDLIWK